MSIHDCSGYVLPLIMQFIDPYERAGVRLVCHAFRNACGDRARKLTPREMWKYATMRAMCARVDEALREGACDLRRYAGSGRATFDECWHAWRASHGTWKAHGRFEANNELRKLRAIVSGDRYEAAHALHCCSPVVILRAAGEHAAAGIIRNEIIGAGKKCDLRFGWDQVVIGTIKAGRHELARELITHWRENFTYDGVDIDIAKFARRALTSGDIELFEFINTKVEMFASTMSGDRTIFAYACAHFSDWWRNVEATFGALEGAVRSGSVEMLSEVREQLLAHEREDGIIANKLAIASYMPQLSTTAVRSGNRAMCNAIIAWATLLGCEDRVCIAMFNTAIARDFYWIADLVLCHVSSIHGPELSSWYIGTMARSFDGSCCAILSRKYIRGKHFLNMCRAHINIAMATLGPLDEFLTARIVALMDPYERVGLRGSSRAFRAACGDALHRMTPRKMWKYAAMRGLDVMMSHACDAGARDLMRYAGSRASFEECRAAWCESFAVWTSARPASVGAAEELAEIRAILAGNRAEMRLILESKECREDPRIIIAIGKYADEDFIREVVIDVKEDTYYGWCAQITAGALIACRDDLARDLVKYAMGEELGDADTLDYLSGCALYAGNIEIFKLINGDTRDKMEDCNRVGDAARSGNVDVFKCARKRYESWRDDIDDVLEHAVASGSIEMFDEVREYDELKGLKHQQSNGSRNVRDLGINFSLRQSASVMARLAKAAARKGAREMCDYVLAWTRAAGNFDKVARAMLNEAIARDFYWIVDLVLAHMRAVHGPGATRPCAEHCAPCCAIMLR